MRIFHCGRCGCVEHLHTWPDGCSLCGGGLSLLEGDDAGFDEADLEAACAVPYDAIEDQARGDTGLARLILFGFAAAVLATAFGDGMAACEERHSFETCHHTLHR